MPPVPVERKLAALLSADAVGYSRLMAEDEDATVRALTAYREQIASLVREHHGRVVDAPGDNLLAEFPAATEAVQCAVEIQGVLAIRNAPLPDDRKMRFRIGVHLGEVRAEDGHIYGDGVNIAARLERLADAGGICISQEVYGQVRNKLDLGFDDLGEQEVKNIPDPVRVYRVQIDPPVAPTAPGATTGVAALVAAAALLVVLAVAVGSWLYFPSLNPVAAPGPIRSIAVLPLENLSGDPEQEYFADGMTEALIGDLAKIRSLRVISRTSVMQYKGERKPLPEIARELGVDGVVEGTVMRAGDRVRITVQLIDARSDAHLWSERYDRELSDVLALQSDVARAVVEQVRLELTAEEEAALEASRPVDPRAYDEYLRAVHLMESGEHPRAVGTTAIEHLQRAVEVDPEFGDGYAELARAHLWFARFASIGETASAARSAREAAQRALELEPNNARAHAALGMARLLYDWDFRGAERALERAAELAPSDPYILNYYALYLSFVGRSEQALEVSERLVAVAPLDLRWREQRARVLFFSRSYERCVEEALRIVEIGSDFGLAYLRLQAAYAQMGRHDEAYRAMITYYEKCGTACDWQREAAERGWAKGGGEGSQRAWLAAATQTPG